MDRSTAEMDWRQRLYDAKAAELLLYGRALGLGESESEDVLQETFVALLKMGSIPDNPIHYCVRAFRNRALNFKRGLWRRVARELESSRWFEPSAAQTDLESAAQLALSADKASGGSTRSDRAENLARDDL
jgi:DNA-directed RNA polymerase specialized sigma24 family protein